MNLGFLFLNKALAYNTREQEYRAFLNSEGFLTEASGFPESRDAANRGLGFLMWQKGEKEDAIVFWQKAKIPALDLVSFGDRAEELHNLDEALSWYAAAADLDLAISATTLAELLNDQKDFAGAVAIWQNALATYPESQHRLYWWLGLSYSLRGNQEWQRAADVSREALNEFPENPQLLTSLGSALLGLNANFETVTRVLQQAISIDENYADAYAIMAQLMSRETRYEEAFKYFSLAIERDPSIKWWHVARADAARRIGDLEVARKLLLETVVRFPRYAPAYFELAWICQLAGDLVQAQIAIEKALELHNAPPLNYYVLAGSIYAGNSQIDLARAAYQRAAELGPDDKRVIEGLESLKSAP